ncbi:MAG: bacillithiol biosynthesis deacetylase BshB1 [Anaerolineaceae bacterium]|nr:bacillithiol biosynthesis deacetylase BshB1 [Anaerolineaceae bacterium]MCB9097941.1 bacillithiol biosynthesis deacetylase BshB1 [Anaerolineales bacterium]
MTDSLDILAFAAHPDDAEIGCGGSLLLTADQGRRVAVVDMSAGEMSTRGNLTQRKQETESASKLLGLSARLALGLPDGYIGTDPDHRIPVIDVIRATRPRIVLAPFWEDRHPDHAAAGKLVREACFFAGVQKIGSGLPHRPESVYYYMLHHPFQPTFVVDISTVWTRKQAAIAAYASQFQAVDDGPQTAISQSGFGRFLEARSIYFGAMIGAAYGEAFYSPGPIALNLFPEPVNASPPLGQLPAYSVWR